MPRTPGPQSQTTKPKTPLSNAANNHIFLWNRARLLKLEQHAGETNSRRHFAAIALATYFYIGIKTASFSVSDPTPDRIQALSCALILIGHFRDAPLFDAPKPGIPFPNQAKITPLKKCPSETVLWEKVKGGDPDHPPSTKLSAAKVRQPLPTVTAGGIDDIMGGLMVPRSSPSG